MSGKSKKQAAPPGAGAAEDAAHGPSGAAAGHAPGDLPYGWYYYGPDPAMQGAAPGPEGPGGPAHGDDAAAYRDAFDQLARGDLNADTLGKLFNLNDRDFWKGALVGAAATLVLTNLPALKSLLAGLAAAGGTSAGQAGGDAPDDRDAAA